MVFQDRVRLEASELLIKIEALKDFLNSTVYVSLEAIDQDTMHTQLNIMKSYYHILEFRIMRF